MIQVNIKFKDEILKLKNYTITYNNAVDKSMKLSYGKENLSMTLFSMEEFPKIIENFNLQEIESIQFK